MKLAFFCDGNRSYLASFSLSKENQLKTYQQVQFESKYLFYDPKIFHTRLLNIAKRLFGLSEVSKSDEIFLVLPVSVSRKRGIIQKTKILDSLAIPYTYEKYKIFNKFVEHFSFDRIHLLNESEAYSYGVLPIIPKDNLPALILSFDQKVGIYLAGSDGKLRRTGYGSLFLINQPEKKVYQSLNEVLDEMLADGVIDVYSKLSENIKDTLVTMLNAYNETKQPLKSIFIVGNTELLNRKKIKSVFNYPPINILDRNYESNILPLLGCVEYKRASYIKPPKITLVEYWSAGEKIYSFDTLEKFCNHYESVFSFANPDNYYKIYDETGATVSRNLGSIDSIEELKEFNF